MQGRSYPPSFQILLTDLNSKIDSALEKNIRKRKPLDFRTKKPPTIKLSTPKFGEKFYANKKLNSPQSQLRELKSKHKQETRGAVRELRKDNWFLANQKIQKQKEEDSERERKRKQIMSLLEQEQHEIKKEKKEKEKKKKSQF